MVAAVLVGALSLVPVGYLLLAVGQAGLDRAARLLWRPRVGELLTNTGLLVLTTIAACAVLGVGGAWLLERTDLPGRRLLAPMLVAPLAVPAFVTSYGWTTAFPGIDGLGGATVIMGLAYYPLVLLPVAGALRGIDPAWEEQVRALGRGPATVFLRVVLPQIRPALLGGSLLVGLHALAEFGAFQGLRFATFTTAIYDSYRSSFAGPVATMLSIALVGCSLVLLTGEAIAGRRRISRIGSGSPRPVVPAGLGPWRLPLLLVPVGLLVAALGVPLSSVARWLARGGRSAWTAEVASAAMSTLVVAAAAAIVTTVAAFPAAYLVTRYRNRLTLTLERIGYLTGSMPGIVIGLALVSLTVQYVKPIYQTTWTLLAAYLVLFLPRALVGIRAGLAQLRPELEEASAALGQGRLRTWWRVTIPLAAPGIATAAALVFLATSTELTATLMLGPTGMATLATRFWSLTGSIDYVAAAPYAALITVLAVPAVFLLLAQSRKAFAR